MFWHTGLSRYFLGMIPKAQAKNGQRGAHQSGRLGRAINRLKEKGKKKFANYLPDKINI